jgi:hypothetical protein
MGVPGLLEGIMKRLLMGVAVVRALPPAGAHMDRENPA